MRGGEGEGYFDDMGCATRICKYRKPRRRMREPLDYTTRLRGQIGPSTSKTASRERRPSPMSSTHLDRYDADNGCSRAATATVAAAVRRLGAIITQCIKHDGGDDDSLEDVYTVNAKPKRRRRRAHLNLIDSPNMVRPAKTPSTAPRTHKNDVEDSPSPSSNVLDSLSPRRRERRQTPIPPVPEDKESASVPARVRRRATVLHT
ncbi:hypothetical protein DFP72DRAFT_402391 [Ephemerocybe angulata]|uniref:Uncharacterized protein n=1 Tax=Ephemerocybe angulata TaxID=980116 RepID=A0A8H6HWB6_9AGAR|nr:hypothetical protein DFP72DRAFT_402391 [Tulosesus angulatus]